MSKQDRFGKISSFNDSFQQKIKIEIQVY